jgi:hypothetical protein
MHDKEEYLDSSGSGRSSDSNDDTSDKIEGGKAHEG